jgi:hypothetical protein
MTRSTSQERDMNFINKLQAENATLRQQQTDALSEIIRLKAMLTGDKFNGVERDGLRKDWASTADINRWLSEIGDILIAR